MISAWKTGLRAGLACLVLAAGSPALAQATGIDALSTAADNGDPAAQRQLGEALVTGTGVAPDKGRGLSLLEAAAAAGDAPAQQVLGSMLLDGYYLAADVARGTALLEQAAAAGNARAQTILGLALLWGVQRPADPARARAYLDQAAASDDPEALRVLGEQLLGGWVLPQDVAAGLPLLQRAVALGDVQAEIALGSAWLYGTGVARDDAKALALFESAAARGNGEGLERYGTMLMWANTDPAEAEALLRRAGELGRGPAWSSLAEGAMYGYLGKGSRGKFDAFAARAVAAGETRVAVLEAQRTMWGISQRASGPDAIAGLEQAVALRNADALKYLVGLVRDGNQLNIRKQPDRAAAYLQENAALLSPQEVDQLAFTIRAARTRKPADFPALAAELKARPDLRSPWFGKELYAANPNFAVYLLQVRMADDGLYNGRPTGLATSGTLRALGRACATLPDPSKCRDSVMNPEAIAQLLAR